MEVVGMGVGLLAGFVPKMVTSAKQFRSATNDSNTRQD
jgi:hypothetical protein